ncbi:hypothetical protein ACT7DB_16505 [Bacillus cereus]
MMRKILCFLICIVMFTGCYDQVYVEDVAATLIVGIDIDQKKSSESICSKFFN